jgi:hypothetical protein
MPVGTKEITVLAAIATMVTVSTIGVQTAFAQTQREQIDTVDEIVHGATGGAASENDVRFHQALCTAGISSTALESLGGCEALPPIGSSD